MSSRFRFRSGIACILFGICLIGAYIQKAVIEPWGRPDQSLLYWLAFLPLAGGGLIFRLGLPLLVKSRQQDKQENDTL